MHGGLLSAARAGEALGSLGRVRARRYVGVFILAVVALCPRTAWADHTVTLPVSQISLTLPGSEGDWRVDADGGADQLTRLSPATPRLRVHLRIQPEEAVDCPAALAAAEAQSAGPVERPSEPPYLPPSYAPQAIEASSAGEQAATVCGERAAGGVVIGIVRVAGGELGGVATVVKPVLESFLAQVNGSGEPVPAPTPGAAETEPTPTPAAAAAPGPGAAPAKPAPVVEPTEPTGMPPGKPAGEGPGEPAEPAGEDDEPIGIGVEAMVLGILPEAAELSDAVGGGGGIFSTFGLLDTEYFGLNLHLNGSIGYNGDDNWMGDVNVGVQPIVYVGPVGLSMIGGAGWDTISGSDEEDGPVYKVPSALYGFFGGRLGFSIVQAVGLIGGIDQLFRGDDTVDQETRIHGGVQLWFGGAITYRALFRYIHFTGADALGGSVGVGF